MADAKSQQDSGFSDVRHAARLSIAPMMDWTDRHCRYLHRLMSREALLYTEMVTAPALVRGGALHLLDFNPEEHPVAVQLGGSDPAELAEATRICCDRGYDEVNLNVGCPSDRVQSGTFGAVLMKQSDLVSQCVAAMIEASSVEVTVKCRIGVDEQDPEQVLPDFIEKSVPPGSAVSRYTRARRGCRGSAPRKTVKSPRWIMTLSCV